MLRSPCAGLLQKIATRLLADLTVFPKPTTCCNTVVWELKCKPSHPLWVLRSLPCLLCQALGQPLAWGGVERCLLPWLASADSENLLS